MTQGKVSNENMYNIHTLLCAEISVKFVKYKRGKFRSKVSWYDRLYGPVGDALEPEKLYTKFFH